MYSRRQTTRGNINNGYIRPSYFGSFKDSAENSYRVISQAGQEKSKSKPKQIAVMQAERNKAKSTQKNKETIQISSTQIVKMRRDLQILSQQANNSKFESDMEFVPYGKATRNNHEQHTLQRTPVANHNHLANVSPIYTKKYLKNQQQQDNDQPGFNDKLDQLIRRLDEIKHSEYMSLAGGVQTSFGDKYAMNMSLKQRQSSRSVNSKRIVEANESMSKEFNLSKKPVKSIFLTSDASHESSRVFMNNFLNGSNRSNQTSQRLNMPTSRETRAGTSSIQYYLLQEKLQKQEPVQLEQLSTMKPHRAKITSIVQSTSSSEMYSTSLDYSVVRLLQDSQTHQTVYSHRGGVECSLLINELLITGGRDCFLRSNREWSRRLPNSISQLLRLRGPERVIAKASHLFEIDLNKCHVSQKCDLNRQVFLLESEHELNGCLVGQGNSLNQYDSRTGRLSQLLKIDDQITCWRMIRDKLVAVGKHLWIGNQNRGNMERIYTPYPKVEVASVVEYYSSYLLCPKNNYDDITLYEYDLQTTSRIETGDKQLSLFSIKNRLICGLPDGRLDFCILK